MRLSGVLFIIVGAVVGGASWYLAEQGQKMSLFIFVGIAMLVFGVWRLFIDSSLPKENQDRARHRADLMAQLPDPNRRHFSDIPRVCSVCKTRNHPRANFCGHCGNKL